MHRYCVYWFFQEGFFLDELWNSKFHTMPCLLYCDCKEIKRYNKNIPCIYEFNSIQLRHMPARIGSDSRSHCTPTSTGMLTFQRATHQPHAHHLVECAVFRWKLAGCWRNPGELAGQNMFFVYSTYSTVSCLYVGIPRGRLWPFLS